MSSNPADNSPTTPATGSPSVPLRKRRWFQYSLRSLFVLTTICGIVAYLSGRWYREIANEEKAISELRSVRSDIEFYSPKSTENGCEFSSPKWFRTLIGKESFTHAKKVDIRSSRQIPLEGFISDTSMPELHLQELNVTESHVALLRHMPSVQTLSFPTDKIPTTALALLHGHPHLKKLSIGPIYGNAVELRALADIPELRELFVGFTDNSFGGCREISCLKLLESLDLSHTPIDDEVLGIIGNMPSIRNLNLRETKITDVGLANLKGMNSLRFLELYRTPVDGHGFRSLNALPLEIIAADETLIDDEGAADISNIHTLTTVEVNGTKITNLGLERILALPKLKTLSASGVIPKAEQKRLKILFPRVKIYF